MKLRENVALVDQGEQQSGSPLLFRKREYLDAIESSGKTTSCQKTSDPDDYGPDD